MAHYGEAGMFYFWTIVFIGAMMGLVFSGNLLFMFCFWEITSLCSWRLIAFYRTETDVEAADRAFLITFCGAAAMLIGIIYIYITYGTLELRALQTTPLSYGISLLLFAGIASKSAQLPLHSWLPDAGVAPTPVTALLHAAVLVKIGIYVFARLFNVTFEPAALFLSTVAWVGVATIIIGGTLAFIENNMKRILAYSTVSQLGFILFLFALHTPAAFTFGLIYILAHSLAKAGLFLCAGIVEHKTGTKDITQLGGLLSSMPYTGVAYILCAFSVIGIAPFLGFWPKFMTVLFAAQQGRVAASILLVVGAGLTLLYLIRLFDKVFLGERKADADEKSSPAMVSAVGFLGVASLVLGLTIKPVFSFVSGLLR
jgi:NADH:ubiquinone oxidoreductase subunit 5 (subunit L)/multisubunit Na+/H+ antiporter MnhA subunit